MKNYDQIIKSLYGLRFTAIADTYAIKLRDNAVSLITRETIDKATSILYSFDVTSLTCRPVNVQTELANVDKGEFMHALKSEFYRVEKIRLDAMTRKYSDITDEMINNAYTDDESRIIIKANLTELIQRVNLALDMLTGFNGVRSNFIESVVFAIRHDCKLPVDMSRPIADIKTELDKLNKDARQRTDGQPSLKNLRALLNVFTTRIWDNAGKWVTTSEYEFHASHGLTIDVWQKSYTGRQMSKGTGDIVLMYADADSLAREIVLACLEDLHNKYVKLADAQVTEG